MQTSSNDFLGEEPVGRLLFRMALPAVTAQLINMLYNIVDRIYIGHIPGEGAMALTGVGVCLPVIMIVTAFASLISMGGAPRASIYMGQKRNDLAEEVLGSCFTAQIFISIGLTAVLLAAGRPMLMAFGASENTIAYAAGYMSIYAIGTAFVQLTLGMNAFITAQGFARTAMYTVLIGAILNIVLDPIFIFAFHMGVKGAALATVISQGVSAFWVVAFLARGKSLLRLRSGAMRLKLDVLGPCLALGIAPFIMQASESVISVCFNSSLLKYGGDTAVGAMTILTSVMQFAMLPLNGVGQGAQPITSYNFGAGNKERVRRTFRTLLKVSVTYAAILWALIMGFPDVFARIFTADTVLIGFTAWALRIYTGAMFMMGIQVACQMTFIAIGNAGASVTVAVMRKFVLLLPLIYLLPALFEDKTMAVYLAEPVADFVAVTFTMILFRFQFRKAIQGMNEKGENV
ncbi:MATE family efflux transporter [Ihubacter sp. rT4E-8]|uniref:MATE family efflux transporter n=1 Tax=Ihubacter sp. rT4E-8 TaxID=3242369 RepID=UPI003CFA5DFD